MQLADILLICSERPVGPTRLMNLNSMSQPIIKPLISGLVKEGLLEQIPANVDKRTKFKYRSTASGQAFIKTLDKLYGIIGLKRPKSTRTF